MAKTIMIVDDSASLRQVVSIALKGAGYDVIQACDGKDALSKLDGKKIHLIISDVNMPNMDGLTMAEKIRTEHKNSAVNIIMLTTENNPSMKERGKAAGIKGWIVKPFNGPAVIETFKKLAS